MRRILAIALLLSLGTTALAEERTVSRGSVELKGGRFTPELEGWSDHYSRDYLHHYGLALNYAPLPALEIGIGAEYLRARGTAIAPIQNQPAGEVTYELMPLHLSLTLRAAFSPNQWLVPYAGGGWTRLHYRQRIRSQDTVDGSVDGHHLRVGVQLLLNRLDGRSAVRMQDEFGIHRTSLFIEGQRIEATLDGIELGGDSFLVGLRFDY